MDLQTILMLAPPILLALTFHEYAHGRAAYRLGDNTAYNQGRLTLNPLAHLDPIGTIILFFPPHFGWARPVPVNPYNFANPRRDLLIVSAAGPAANLVLAFISGMLLRLNGASGMFTHTVYGNFFIQMILYSIIINIVLAFFNLIPIPPLDGSKILSGMLRGEAAFQYAKMERYGPIIFIAVIAGSYFLKIPLLWWYFRPFVKLFSILFAGVDLSGW